MDFVEKGRGVPPESYVEEFKCRESCGSLLRVVFDDLFMVSFNAGATPTAYPAFFCIGCGYRNDLMGNREVPPHVVKRLPSLDEWRERRKGRS